MAYYAFRKGIRYLRQLAGLNYGDTVALPDAQRSSLHNMYLNGIFGSFSDGASGSYTNVFMVALRATDTQIGFLNTFTQALAALAPLPGALVAERTGAYRATVLWPSVLARVGFVLLVALPLFQIGQPVIAAAIVIFSLRSFLLSLVGAPWAAAMGQMVPLRIRANYFSARNFAGGVAVIAGTLLAGQIITGFGFPSGYQIVYLMSALVGFYASSVYARVPGTAYGSLEGRKPDDQDTRRKISLLAFLRHGPFARFVLCSCVLSFAVSVGGPFIALYQVRVLQFDAATIGVLASAELAMNIVMQRVYGSLLIPRFGDYRVMRSLRFATGLVPLAWLFVRDPIAGALVGVGAGAIWSGHELANFNGLLEIASEEGRASYIAVYTVLTSLSAALGPAIGGLLTGVIGYHPLFITSGVLRMLSAVLLLLLVRDWATKPMPDHSVKEASETL